jgi:polyhydroxybutyrate depolymerase
MRRTTCRALCSIAVAVATLAPTPLAAGGGGASPGGSSQGCGKPAFGSPGASTPLNIKSGGKRRLAVVHLPPSYDVSSPTALILFFHGHGGAARSSDLTIGLTQVADREGFVVVYPQGTKAPSDDKTSWNIGGHLTKPDDDVAFVNDLLDELETRLCVDRRRVFAAGFSNGGGMAAFLACEAADRIAAVASGSGAYIDLPQPCEPARAVSILEFHGTADPTVPYNGGRGDLLAVAPWLAAWADRDRCDPAPTVVATVGTATDERWTGCTDGVVVEHWKVEGWGHQWLGSTTPTRGSTTPTRGSTTPTRGGTPPANGRRPRNSAPAPINANDLSWMFFQQHPLPEAP